MSRVPETSKRGADALPPSNPPAPLASIDRETDLTEVPSIMTPREYTTHLSATRRGPHQDDTTTAVAALVAEAVRWLAYATRPGADGLSSPATLYDLVIKLNTTISRLPQVLSQTADWLAAEVSAGRVVSNEPVSIDDARDALGDAITEADNLSRALANASNLAAALRSAEGGEDR